MNQEINSIWSIDPIYLFFAAAIFITFVGAFFVFFLFKSDKSSQTTPDRRPVDEKLSSTEPPLHPPKRPRFSKAFSSWVPLFKENSKDNSKWEEVLISSDMGPQLCSELLSQLKDTDLSALEYFKSVLRGLLIRPDSIQSLAAKHKPWVIFIVGVNGVGKTTSVVKLGHFFHQMQKSVGVIGADTFRKAAIEQLERGCLSQQLDFFSSKKSEESSEGADPAAVIFDGLKKFASKDIVLVDTSGRLHTKQNLMDELRKMKKVANKALEGAPHDVWMVLDASLGQNALVQTRVFDQAIEITGLILTKWDGISRGGIVFEIFREFKRPVYFLGVGEKPSDLEIFHPDNFVEELFDDEARKSIV
jgi:fused signal recognition particle receptor